MRRFGGLKVEAQRYKGMRRATQRPGRQFVSRAFALRRLFGEPVTCNL